MPAVGGDCHDGTPPGGCEPCAYGDVGGTTGGTVPPGEVKGAPAPITLPHTSHDTADAVSGA